MILRCPSCHAKHPAEAFSEDAQAAELLRLAFGGAVPRSLLRYLALFRTGKQDLKWSRALALAEQALDLEPDFLRLEAAMAETVEAIHAKRQEGGQLDPFKNHNYLKKVLRSIGDVVVAPVIEAPQVEQRPQRGKRAKALANLEGWGQ